MKNIGRTLIILVLAGIVGGGYFMYEKFKPSHLTVVNGLDIPVTVAVESESKTWSATVNPLQLATWDQGISGAFHVTVTNAAGEVIEEQDIEIPRSQDVVIYNVAGAAAVYFQELIYTTSVTSQVTEQQDLSYYGRHLIVRDDVDYLFTEPPAEVNVSSRSSQTVQWQVTWAGNGHWTVAADTLWGDPFRQEEARSLVTRVLAADPTNPTALAYASNYGVTAQPVAPGPTPGSPIQGVAPTAPGPGVAPNPGTPPTPNLAAPGLPQPPSNP